MQRTPANIVSISYPFSRRPRRVSGHRRNNLPRPISSTRRHWPLPLARHLVLILSLQALTAGRAHSRSRPFEPTVTYSIRTACSCKLPTHKRDFSDRVRGIVLRTWFGVIAVSLVVSSTARNLFQVTVKATHSIGAFFGGVEVKVPIYLVQRRS